MLSYAFGNSMTSAGIIIQPGVRIFAGLCPRHQHHPASSFRFRQAASPRDFIFVLAGHVAIKRKDLKRGHVLTGRTILIT